MASSHNFYYKYVYFFKELVKVLRYMRYIFVCVHTLKVNKSVANIHEDAVRADLLLLLKTKLK